MKHEVPVSFCECGREATTLYKPMGKRVCSECAVKAMIENIMHRHGIEDIYVAPMGDDGVDFFVPLVDSIPISFCRN